MRQAPDWRARFLAWVSVVSLLGSMGALSGGTLAQEQATPAGTGATIVSQTREQFAAEIAEDLGYTEAATPGGAFVGANLGDIQTLHPLLAEDEYSLNLVWMVYDGLIGRDVRTGAPAPNGLADFWEIAPDGVTYSFHLNPEATWHDGVDVTAEDVRFSFDAMANPDLGSAYTQSFLEATESWRVIDEDTFEVVAKEPLYTFIHELANRVIPKHVWEDVPVAEWRTDGGATGQDPSRVIGSGAWRFQEWRPGESVTLVRNDDYFQKVPYLDSYVVRIFADQTALVNALLNGEIDAGLLEDADIATVEAADGLAVTSYPTESFNFYLTNLDPEQSTLFLDQRVRQALLYALDRQAIVDDILLGTAETARGTQPVVSYAYAPERIATEYAYDPERASALLAEAGWADSDGDGILDRDGEAFAFEILHPSGFSSTDQVMAYVQDAWRAVGIDATPRAMEFPALVTAIAVDHDFAMAAIGFAWDTSFIQDSLFGCDQYEGGFNVVRYCNEELDALHEQARRTFDDAARTELMIEAANIVNEELPVAVLYFSDEIVGSRDDLRNFVPGVGGVDYSQVWIEG